MQIGTNEMRFFQDAYFLGLRIKYIDLTRHSPYKYSFEYHIDGHTVYTADADSEKDILDIARAFFTDCEGEARQNQTAFFILRLATIKICFVFE